jgi:hypothetical protein
MFRAMNTSRQILPDWGVRCTAAFFEGKVSLGGGVSPVPERMHRFMAVAWLLVLAKCALIWWAIGHWHVPFHPLWVVGPTLLFAVLATGAWLAGPPRTT